MPTIKNGELEAALTALNELAGIAVPMGTALRIRALIRALAPRYQDVESERMKLLERYAQRGADGTLVVKDEGGGRVTYSLADAPAFQSAYLELMTLETECEGVEVGALGDISIRPKILLDLGPLLIEGVSTQELTPAPTGTNGR